MNQCGRCLKMTDGVHTCTPTEYARRIEAERDKLLGKVQIRDRLLEAHRKDHSACAERASVAETRNHTLLERQAAMIAEFRDWYFEVCETESSRFWEIINKYEVNS
jgi:hypothetical protein